ncbi:MAG: electron transport complex subunit RsxA [bacterium (Candidatus Stahlbacteria) CG08_land_8_20_14_0_20_40_26]|nr:MAG: electron transport complex subunit RsxA [bacterium (Candidatus Stahlbacteria) CG23_combo_of_CG06-09_8_20_14_all_40_9]PIS24944.1 MAG: electron transport complex subunit RsxA [bacterium (Candidatus Stahlbacteria) CG08_land_8_20_14_0_20_40_26]
MSPFLIFLSAFLVNNIVLMRFLGLCPYFGVSRRTDTALGMSMGVLFVMLLASWITFFIYHYLLVPLDLIFLRTAAFILVIASLVQLIELFLKKNVPTLYQALGIYLPLITTNCAILGITFLIIDYDYTLLQATVFSIGTAMGFGLALLLMAGMREQIDLAPVPDALKGSPIAFITASLTSLAFLGFAGLLGLSI